jgi:hypothetical protein
VALVILCVAIVGGGVVAVAVERVAANADQPAMESADLPSARGRWGDIARRTRDRAETVARTTCRGAVRCIDRSGLAVGFARGALARTSVRAADSCRHATAVSGRVAGKAGARTGRTVRSVSVRAGRATGRASMRAGEATGQATAQAGRATAHAGTRAGRRAAGIARAGGAVLVATAAAIGASTVAALGAGKAHTAAFVRRATAGTRRTGARTAAGTAEAVRRGGGRATVATRRGTRRAAHATRRAATRLVPEPVVLPDDAEDRGARFPREPAAVTGVPAVGASKPAPPESVSPEPEPVASAPSPPALEPEPASSAPSPPALQPEPVAFEPEPATTASGPPAVEAAGQVPPGPIGLSTGHGRRPQERREQGQVVPLRPRATTRLKATGELLVLVAVLGLVVSSIIVALAVAGNQVLSGL